VTTRAACRKAAREVHCPRLKVAYFKTSGKYTL
jgi:hypothetical protein